MTGRTRKNLRHRGVTRKQRGAGQCFGKQQCPQSNSPNTKKRKARAQLKKPLVPKKTYKQIRKEEKIKVKEAYIKMKQEMGLPPSPEKNNSNSNNNNAAWGISTFNMPEKE